MVAWKRRPKWLNQPQVAEVWEIVHLDAVGTALLHGALCMSKARQIAA